MHSLLDKEGLAGSVQTVFMDPPYGINFQSNFQPFVHKPNVSSNDDTDANLNTEPGVIRAFRDTWELGIHSYLNYLRNRLMVIKKLLNDSGSCFIQINDTNQHYVRNIMDEIFGKENLVSMIVYKTARQSPAKLMSNLCDYIIWYAKDKNKVKYRQLHEQSSPSTENLTPYRIELPDGTNRRLTPDERNNPNLIDIKSLYRTVRIRSVSGKAFNFEFNGKIYNDTWTLNKAGMNNLKEAGRLVESGSNLEFKQYFTDRNGYAPLNNIWLNIPPNAGKRFVVQTSANAVRRCLQMSTDPGDLVIDPTCGSGVTAAIAEELGRRWITIDTSRIAIQLARARLMTSTYDWYKLAHEDKGVSAGFQYKTTEIITRKSLAQKEQPEKIILYNQPEQDSKIIRVAGSFTVEAIPAPIVKPLHEITDETEIIDDNLARSGETVRQDNLRTRLVDGGITDSKNQKMEFISVEPAPRTTQYIQAQAETTTGKHVAIHFGQDNAPISQEIVKLVLDEVRTLNPSPDIMLFAGFQFDPHAAQKIDDVQEEEVAVLRAIIDSDLTVSDLKSNKKKTANQSFHLIGRPDVAIDKTNGEYVVKLLGFDYYNHETGQVQSGQGGDIAMWMLDIDYNNRSLLPIQIFFPMSDMQKDMKKLMRTLGSEIDEILIEKFKGLESIPFNAGKNQCCAVKIIDNRGLESLRIINLTWTTIQSYGDKNWTINYQFSLSRT